MKVLIDTRVLLWSLENPERIRGPARATLSDDQTIIVVSVINLWEIAIKRRRGDLTAPEDLPAIVREFGHEILEVSAEHAWHVRTLPLHHGDPFDRLLVAQAQLEDLPLITHDRQIARYDVRIIRA